MGKYIKIPNVSFSSDNLGQVTLKNTINDIGLGKTIVIPNVSFASNNLGKVHIRNEHYFEYFTIESLADNNTISIAKANSPSNINLSYSTNDGETWNDLTISTTTTFTTINTGDKIIFKGTNDKFANAWDSFYRFNATGIFKVYGNIMSLLFGDNYVSNTKFKTETTHNFAGLFYGTTTLIDTSNLIMPALTCMSSSYNGMFRGCTNLTTAPELPAINSAQDCYSSMFEGCINLEIAPEINLENMSQNCCKRMFCMNRSSKITTPKMTKSPILRCATGVSGCYEEMFKGNGNLIEVTCLKTDDIACCNNWLLNCSSIGTFYKSPLKTNWESNTSNIPIGWTVVDYVEE